MENYMQKKLIISHNKDIDGMGSVILLNSIFDNVDYILMGISYNEQEELLQVLREEIDNYSDIYICDIPLNEDIAKMISFLGNNIHHFDHHITNIGTNKYDFSNVIVNKNGIMQCATSIFYDYLLSNYNNKLLESNGTIELVELIRTMDTWDTDSKNFNKARDLATLFDCIGQDNFINLFTNKIKSNFTEFEFSDDELDLINNRKREIEDYINYCSEQMKIIDYEGYRCGVVECNKYSTEVGNALCDRYFDTIDFVAMLGKRCSFRTRKDIDVSKIAQTYGGGGHIKASGCEINSKLLKDFSAKTKVLN